MAKTSKKSVSEETLSASTLHPAARPVTDDPKSRFEILSSMIGAMHTMRDDHLQDLYYKSLDIIGHEADPVGDPSEHNKASINMKPSAAEGTPGDHGEEMGMPRLDGKGNPVEHVDSELDLGKTKPELRMAMPKISVKEDVEALFNGQELSEEFKADAAMLFETAVTARVILEAERLEATYKQRLDESAQSIHEEMEKRLDAYLDYTVQQWLEENEVAINTGVRAQLMEDLFESLRGVFLEHNVNVPEEKVEVVEALGARIDEMQEQMDELIGQNTEMKDVIMKYALDEVVDKGAHGLSLSQQEKFKKLAEAVEFTGDIEQYERKLAVVRKNYFETKSAPGKTNLEEETFEGDVGKKPVLDEMDHYVAALDRGLRK